LSYVMGELEYDHVTEPPTYFNQVAVANYTGAAHAETLPDPKGRRYVGTYSPQEADEIVTIVRSSAAIFRNVKGFRHTMKEYEDLFFQITIARIRILRLARTGVLLAVLFSMAFVLHFAAFPPANVSSRSVPFELITEHP
jgi:hypothetical protein